MPAESVDGRKRQEQYEKFLDMIGTLDGTLPPYDLDHIVARHQFRQEQVKLIPASSAVHMLIEADRHIDVLLDQLLGLMASTSTGTVTGDGSGTPLPPLDPEAARLGIAMKARDYPSEGFLPNYCPRCGAHRNDATVFTCGHPVVALSPVSAGGVE